MYPPSAGGPATHSKKLENYFGDRAKLFVFENLNKYPPGIRHLFAFLKIFLISLNCKIVFALDGFSVALPAVLVSKILRVPIVLRIGGDLVHEQFVESGQMVAMNEFYDHFYEHNKKLSSGLKVKMYLHKWLIENSTGIIFNTNWQKEMYEKVYKLPKKVWVLYNPLDKSEICQIVSSLENIELQEIKKTKYIVSSITRPVPFKNQKLIKEIIEEINSENILNKQIHFETGRGPWENTLKKISLSDLYISCAISDIAPNQLLEALALGVPSIVTRNTGYFDQLKDIYGVHFVNPRDKAQIKGEIVKLLGETENKLEKESLKNFEWPYTWENYFREYEKIIKEFEI
jgi:glycosyltransferase involved in cell wall biosynthesis